MALHQATVELLLNEGKLRQVARALDIGASKRYIRDTFTITHRQLQHVVKWHQREKTSAAR